MPKPQDSSTPDLSARFARAKFRSWHRGTREADYTFGGYFDRYNGTWDEAGLSWFEALLDEDDVDVLAWAFGTADVPPQFLGPMMEAMQRLDFVEIPR
jgi:antitoxin CptB